MSVGDYCFLARLNEDYCWDEACEEGVQDHGFYVVGVCFFGIYVEVRY